MRQTIASKSKFLLETKEIWYRNIATVQRRRIPVHGGVFWNTN